MDHLNQVSEADDAFLPVLLHRIDIATGELVEAVFDGGAPNYVVDEKSYLGWIALDPLGSLGGLLGFERGTGKLI